ncbi:acetoacetate--CoA ligase [Agrobacterium sp. Rnr]|uniref:Acetoacetate--CoA ligase n=2 Tax=Agrobacterium burrii TaxID=2815339 RepID=A0ABS3EJT7_9HYPH|nr:acetoacetate--CoA ligase [Agrobacterium burrii]
MEDQPLWRPDGARVSESAIEGFREWCAYSHCTPMADHSALHRWSIDEPGDFWRALWDYYEVKGWPGPRSLVNGSDMMAARFFPDGTLNFAQNLLSREGPEDALIFRGEDRVEYRWSWDRLRADVLRLQRAFKAMGIVKGDRIAAMMPNLPETVACMLATASIGAVWASCSPDFGEAGVFDRFGQIEPKLFITCDAYWYGGKLQDVSGKVRNLESRLACPVLVVHYAGDAEALASSLVDARAYDSIVAEDVEAELEFVLLPFSHPLYILFSSGTTGAPKCIIHSAGGTLLQHIKEHRLHCDIRPGDRVFYFTTCGWMMWNWLVSGLASGATLCLFDGSPFHPDPGVLWRFASDERLSFFGTSAKYIDSLRKSDFRIDETVGLDALMTIASTGSPLGGDGFDYVYQHIKSDVLLASVSGGTDIVSCFVLGNPVSPVWRGEIQGPGLGLAVDVWDEQGQRVSEGKGELVCTKPFPSMPVGFWNDPDNVKYKAAYFDRFDNVWCHGDFAEWTRHSGLIIHGRSDATLNPGGVRIGTAEIYNQVEQLPEVAEAICVGQEVEDDVRVLLFVKLVTGRTLDAELESAIKLKIRTGASPRHVPAKILQVSDIPRTKSGKLVELAVKNVISGKEVSNLNSLQNPGALEEFARLRDQVLSH